VARKRETERRRRREEKESERKGKKDKSTRRGKGGTYSNVDEIDQTRFDLASSNIRQEIGANI